jgi:hypothetical protein
MANAVKAEPKKPYVRPALTVHGTVRDLTRATGKGGRKDGGKFGNKYTSMG